MLLCDALGLQRPSWYHAPLVLDAAGRRLAKRHDDLALATLRSAGVDHRAVVAWALSSAGFDVGERISAEDARSLFDLEVVLRQPTLLSEDVLKQLRAAS